MTLFPISRTPKLNNLNSRIPKNIYDRSQWNNVDTKERSINRKGTI